jgi:hypothetical protein
VSCAFAPVAGEDHGRPPCAPLDSLTIDQVPASDGGDERGTALLAAVFAQVVLLIVRKPPPASR